MKTIGMIGGTSWVSTLEYYRLINEGVNMRLGGIEAARCIIYSFNFADIARLHDEDPTLEATGKAIGEAAETLAAAGAEVLVICANTIHMFAEDVKARVSIPLVHIAEATAAEIKKRGLSRVGLLGTKMTMEKDFYHKELARAGIETLVPDLGDRDYIDDVIMTEMVKGLFRPEVRTRFAGIIGGLADRGAEGVVLGCTEIPLLMGREGAAVPMFDTLEIHARAVVDAALAGE